MKDINIIITRNINALMKKQDISQSELAEKLGITKVDVRRMLNEASRLNAKQLHQIADCFEISFEALVSEQKDIEYIDALHSMMNKVHTDAAREALEIADELADMIIFHARVMENAKAMMQVMEYI